MDTAEARCLPHMYTSSCNLQLNRCNASNRRLLMRSKSILQLLDLKTKHIKSVTNNLKMMRDTVSHLLTICILATVCVERLSIQEYLELAWNPSRKNETPEGTDA